MSQTIIQQAAEAIIIKDNNCIIKRRIAKGYRIKEIDEKLIARRTRAEAKIMEKLQNIVNVPKIIKADEKTKEIIMEFIEGKKLSENLDNSNLEQQKQIMQKLAEEIAKLHNENMIHGDLTTSNMILKENTCNKTNETTKTNENNPPQKNNIFLIDFGLSFHSKKIEDKAVDLHLLKQALESRHFQNWHVLFNSFLLAYNPKDKTQILKQLEKVELRGRYKH